MTVTNTHIRQLRTEAAEAGDIATRILCDMALDGEDSCYNADCLDEDGRPDYSGGGHARSELAEIRRVLRLSQDEALDEVVAMIADAAAA